MYPIPNNFFQLWINYQSTVVPDKYPANMTNLVATRSTPPIGWSNVVFFVDLMNWWNAGMGLVMYAPVSQPYILGFFSNWSSFGGYQTVSIPYPVLYSSDCCPAGSTVVVRRVSPIRVRGAGSCLHFNGARNSDVVDNILIPPVAAAWRAAAQMFKTPFVSQGVTFRPVIPYYSFSNFRVPSHVFVSGKMCTLYRRTKPGKPEQFPFPPRGPVPFP